MSLVLLGVMLAIGVLSGFVSLVTCAIASGLVVGYMAFVFMRRFNLLGCCH